MVWFIPSADIPTVPVLRASSTSKCDSVPAYNLVKWLLWLLTRWSSLLVEEGYSFGFSLRTHCSLHSLFILVILVFSPSSSFLTGVSVLAGLREACCGRVMSSSSTWHGQTGHQGSRQAEVHVAVPFPPSLLATYPRLRHWAYDDFF